MLVKPPQRGGVRMTAEVAIVNKHAIALAADSAVTVGRERVWKYANKLFSAGPSNDIGIMIYNSGDFLGIPWETIVKEHRRHCGVKEFATVADFADDFLSFVKSDKFSEPNAQRVSFLLILMQLFQLVKRGMKYSTRTEFYAALPHATTTWITELSVQTAVFQIDKVQFSRNYRTLIRQLAETVFERKPKREMVDGLVDLSHEYLCRSAESEFSTGVVFAGYGRSELLPSIIHKIFDGKDLNVTRIWTKKEWDYNKMKPGDDGGRVIPFAQSDMFFLFMEGISNQYLRFLRESIKKTLRNKSKELVDAFVTDPHQKGVENTKQDSDNAIILDEFFKEFQRYRQEVLVSPTVNTITSLPKEEMASMAVAMVELTALRRKVDSSIESVGGPVDVVVISKGDGLIWMNRKHYFDIDKNADFIIRKEIGRGATP
ncbi:MAG: hypothetical protein EPN75_07720 [Beijerinckiaceae bacterium]|nr:MAG: hypothetical protein EPN75_07720 [Beijerinckiaceae bacterium]